ncbi:MAG TPA: CBS domain-containing protein [Streptosporangiaceae bacterium]|nr:CBS domain-containing protein [Streptosporangiaceae bacterium]
MGRRTVADVMTTAVVSAYAGATFKDIATIMAGRGFGAVPVVGDGHRVIGVVSESDLLAGTDDDDEGGRRPFGRLRGGLATRHAHALKAGQLMSSPPITVRPETTIAEAGRLMHRAKVKHLPVVDDEDRLIGIVSRRDLLRVFARDDEEIRAEVTENVIGPLLGADAREVSVIVNKGVVTLTGHVAKPNLIAPAVHLAAGTDGVVDVIDRLTVAAVT